MVGRMLGPCLMTAIVMLILGYFLGASYPRIARQLTATVTG